MPPVKSCLHCQFLSHVSKALFFNQNSPKIMLFLQKNAKFSSASGSAPRPLCLRRLGAFPPNPQPLAAGGSAPRPPLASGSWGSAPRPPKQPPHCEFLATHRFFSDNCLSQTCFIYIFLSAFVLSSNQTS